VSKQKSESIHTKIRKYPNKSGRIQTKSESIHTRVRAFFTKLPISEAHENLNVRKKLLHNYVSSLNLESIICVN